MNQIIELIIQHSEIFLYILIGLLCLVLLMLFALISLNHRIKKAQNSIYYTKAFKYLGVAEREELQARAKDRNIDVESYVAYIIQRDLGYLPDSGAELFRK